MNEYEDALEADKYGNALAWRKLDDGRVLVLERMITNVALHLGPENSLSFDFEWSYPLEAMDIALNAVRTWDGEGDPPPGWTRAYPPFYRRRPDGDPSKEYTAP